jgi:uridine phosphorylase
VSKVYHLGLDRRMTRGAKIALLPGDPGRVASIAGAVSKAYGSAHSSLASNREFATSLAGSPAGDVLVTSTGIGGPSTSIVIEELARLGVRTFIRVGTTGAIQDRIRDGDCIITTASVRLDGASRHYAPVEFPAVADFSVVAALIHGAEAAGVAHHTGVTASSDTFYAGEERTDAFRKYTIRDVRGSTEEWRRLGVLNYEMESATLLVMTASMGMKGGCVTGVVNRGSTGRITPGSLKLGEDNAVKTTVRALGLLKGD